MGTRFLSTKIERKYIQLLKPIEYCSISELRTREKFWMRELNTVFPNGLKDRIDVEGIRDAYQHSGEPRTIYSLSNVVKNGRRKRGSGINKKDKNYVNIIDPYLFFEEIIQANTISIANLTCKKIMELSIQDIKLLTLYISKEVISSNTKYPFNEHLLFIICDMFE